MKDDQARTEPSGGSGLVAKSCPTLATSWTIDCQVPLSLGFSKQEYWSGLPFPAPRTEAAVWLFLRTNKVTPWHRSIHQMFASGVKQIFKTKLKKSYASLTIWKI